MVKLRELREYSLKVLSENKIEEARADTDFLLFFLLGAKKEDIIFGEKEVDSEKAKSFYEAVERRVNGEPVQYIVGDVDFYGNIIKVDKRVLIPRFETEGLCEIALNYLTNTNLNVIVLSKSVTDDLVNGMPSLCI